jgi:hypothetical protein
MLCGVQRLGAAMIAYGDPTALATIVDDPSEGASLIDLAWGDWKHDATRYYEEAAHLIRDISLARLIEIGGAEVREHVAALRAAYIQHRDASIPQHLRLAALGIMRIDDIKRAVCGYSKRDMPIMRASVLDALTHFDGQRSTSTVLRELNEGGNLIDEDMVHMLVDFGVLTAVPDLSQTAHSASANPVDIASINNGS